MKKKLISILQLLIIFGGIAIYLGYNFKKKYPLMHLVSEPQSNLKYDIQYFSKEKIRIRKDVKTLLTDIHEALKVDLAQSDVYNFNQYDCTPYFLKYPYTFQVLRIYKDVFFYSNGLYDPTLEFFFRKIRDKDGIIQTKNLENTKYQNLFVESKPFIGFDYVMVNNNRLKKLKSEVCLNLDHTICACQAKNLADFLKSKSINDFYLILGNEIVTNGFRDGKKKLWNVVYSVPVEINENGDDIENAKAKNKNVKIIFTLKDKAISVLNNTEEPSSLENFYLEDLKEFEKCEEEMKLYIKRCKFVFYKNNAKINKSIPTYNFLVSKMSEKNKILFNLFLTKLKKGERDSCENFIWKTESYVYQPFANYSNEDLMKALNEQSFRRKIKYQKNLKSTILMKKLRLEMKKIFLEFLESDEYRKNLFKNYEIDEDWKRSDKTIFSDIKIEKSKNILFNRDGEFFPPKYICGFVISDNPILSKCLASSCRVNDFSDANEIFSKFKNHQCSYFVLYQDEDKNLYYKSSKQLKVKIDNYRYLISL